MTLSDLAELSPRLFHIPGSGSSKTFRNGLLSTGKLLEKMADAGKVEWRCEGEIKWRSSDWRELNRTHRHATLSVRSLKDSDLTVSIRDQRPIGNLQALERYLTDMSGSEWIEHLNSRVYLFPSQRRTNQICPDAEKLRQKYDLKPIVLETKNLPASVFGRIQVCFINAGAINGIALRGRDTFQGIELLRVGDFGRVREITVLDGIAPTELKQCCITPWLLAALGK